MTTEPDPRLPADEAARLFALLADETRLRLLLLLAARDGDVTAEESARALGVPEADLAHHLRLLGTAGVVTCRREGENLCYSLAPGPVRDLLSKIEP
jgi:DNA-binding transcriptional ArsR family regulator